MSGPSLLVVDDEPVLRRALARDFERRGYQVAVAGGGHEAFSLAVERRFDAVLTDVRMADGDGIELLHELKRHQPELAVVLITGFSEVGVGDAFTWGAEAMFAKPYDRGALQAAIAETVKPPAQRWRTTPRYSLEIGEVGAPSVERWHGEATVFGAVPRELSLGLPTSPPGARLGQVLGFTLRFGSEQPPAPGAGVVRDFAVGADGRVELLLSLEGLVASERNLVAMLVNEGRTTRAK